MSAKKLYLQLSVAALALIYLSGCARAATYTVTSTAGSGSGSVAAALTSANGSATSTDTITFSSLFNTAQTIDLTAAEPLLAKTTGTLSMSPTATLTFSSSLYTALGVSGGTFDVSNVDVTGNGVSGVDVTGGTMALSQSSISDGVTVATGTLSVSNTTLSGPVYLAGGTLQTVTGISAPTELGVSNSGTISVSSGQTSTFTNVVSENSVQSTATLNVTGSGTVVLTGNNAMAPSFEVTNGGTLSVSNFQNVGEALVTLSGGTLLTTASVNFSFSSTALAGTGGTINVSGASNTTQIDEITGSGGLTVTGAGTLELADTSTFTGGITVTGGATLEADRDYQLGATSGGITLNNGTLETSDGLETSRAISLGVNGGTVAIGTSAGTALTGTISGIGGLTVTGSGGNYGGGVALASGNRYGGGTTVNGTVLSITDDTSLGNSSGGVTLNGGVLEYDSSFNSSRTITLGSAGGTIRGYSYNPPLSTVSGQITGTGALTLGGTDYSTVALSSTQNNYSGGTTVTFGTTLLIQNGTGANSGSATGSGALSLASGSVLMGQGTINASSFTFQGAQVYVGNGTDTTSQMNLTGTTASTINGVDLVFNLGIGQYQGQSNELNLGSTPVTFTNSQVDFNLIGDGGLQGGSSYTLITTSAPIDPAAYGLTTNSDGVITGGLLDDAGDPASGSYLYVSGDDIDVYVAPEPSVWSLLGLGFALLVLHRARRAKGAGQAVSPLQGLAPVLKRKPRASPWATMSRPFGAEDV